MDDLFLDIVVFPTGEVTVLDEDELDKELSKRVINKSMYDLAWREARELIDSIHNGNFNLINLAKAHNEIVRNKS